MTTDKDTTHTTPAMADLDIDKLEALTDAATPGPWMRLFGERTIYDRMSDGCRGNAIVRADVGYNSVDAANLDFIAAANPVAVRQLIALARRAAQPVAPSPQVAEELPKAKHQIDIYHADGRVTAVDGYTADEMRDAIAASRRAPQVAEGAGLPFRERFKEAYSMVAAAVFASPFWSQSMEELLSVIDAELNKRADAIAASRRAATVEPVAWIRKTDITELTDSEPETEGWVPLYATPAPASAGQAAPASEWSKWPDWEKCGRISDLPDVDEALRGFSDDPTADNATCVVRAILAAQPAEGAGQAGQVAANLLQALIDVCDAALPVTNAAYNIGQSHEQWDTIKGHIAKLDNLRSQAHELIRSVRQGATERAAAPADDRPCTEQMRKAGLPAPRTCPTCKLGPCKFATHQPSAQDGGEA